MRLVSVVVSSQLLFTAGDLLARAKLRNLGFHVGSFTSWWFGLYMLLRSVATVGQLWILSKSNLGKALPMFSATAVVLSVALSVVALNEGLTTRMIVGGTLAVVAMLVLASGQ